MATYKVPAGKAAAAARPAPLRDSSAALQQPKQEQAGYKQHVWCAGGKKITLKPAMTTQANEGSRFLQEMGLSSKAQCQTWNLFWKRGKPNFVSHFLWQILTDKLESCRNLSLVFCNPQTHTFEPAYWLSSEFQRRNVMAILGDPEKRELYDQTGSIAAADIDGDAVKSLYKFLRTLFKQVTSFVQIRLFFAFFLFFLKLGSSSFFCFAGDRGGYYCVFSVLSRLEGGREGFTGIVHQVQG